MKKKIIIAISSFLLVLIVTAVVLPFIFKDKIKQIVNREANKNLNARLSFQDIELSFIRRFPKVSISIEKLNIYGIDEFNSDTLINAEKISVSANLFSFISGSEIEISAIEVSNAKILLKILKNGKANWDITKPALAGQPEEPSNVRIMLKKYNLENSDIIYDDREMNLKAELIGLNHSGSGDFTADFTELKTKTLVESLSLSYGGIRYLNKIKTNYLADFGLNFKNSIYEFKENELIMNDLALKFSGKISKPADDIDMDIKFETPKNDVKSLFSLIPGSFTQDFKDLKSSGKLSLNGFVKGKYNEKSIPGFSLNMEIQNGKIQYPSLPKSINNIQVKTLVINPGGDLDKTIIDISSIHADLGSFPVDLRMNIQKPISDPKIDMELRCKMNLAELKEFYPIEKATELEGKIQADILLKGRLSDMENKAYDKILASGKIDLKEIRYKTPEINQVIELRNAEFVFTPQSLSMPVMNLKTGKSDITGQGDFTGYLGYFLKNKSLDGNLIISSNYLDLNPFMTSVGAKDTSSGPVTEGSGYIAIPDNINFKLDAELKNLIYDNMKLTGIKGKLTIANKSANLQNLEMNSLGGKIMINGIYNTQSESGPAIDLKMQMNGINIRESASTFSSIALLAPIARHADGNIDINLNFAAKANKDFDLQYESLNGSGFIQGKSVSVKGFEMTNKIADKLKIDKLKQWRLEDFSTNFSIREGKIFVEPFPVKLDKYKAMIGGSNSLDQKIDYLINIEIPRNEFNKNINVELNNLFEKAKSKGIDTQFGETIPVALKITGTFSKPVISSDIKSKASDEMERLKKMAQEKLQQETDRRKKELEDKIQAEKDQIIKEAEIQKEKLKTEAENAKKEAERRLNEEKEKAKKNIEDEARKKLKKLFNNN